MTDMPIPYEDLGDEELTPEEDALARALIAQAEQDIEEARVSFRWGKAQLDVVKRAAAIIGVPCQTYMKQIVFKQAIADLRSFGAGKKRAVTGGRA